MAFGTRVEADLQRISARPRQPQDYPDAILQAEVDWDQMEKRIGENNYTVFENENDPGATDKQLREGWFEEALNHTFPSQNCKPLGLDGIPSQKPGREASVPSKSI